MRPIIAVAALASLSMIIAETVEAKDLRKESQFLDAVAGKKLISGDTWFVISADGKISGVGRNNAKVVGAWAWNKRYWCRNVVIGDKQLPEDCQKVSINGNQVTFTRDKGKGESGIFTISD